MVNKAKIVLVGTFHMKEYPEFIQNQQDEIIELMEYLSEYNPTKIAVEWSKEDADQLNNEYREFINDGELKTGEVYELGFRLAKKLQHSQLYPVDCNGRIDDEELTALFSEIEKNYPDILEKLTDFKNKQIEPEDEVSIIEVFKQLNDIKRVNELQQIYISFSNVKQGNSSIGIDFLTKWHERELGIFSNVMEIAKGSDDKILLITGGDHLWTLRNLFEDSGFFEVEELKLGR